MTIGEGASAEEAPDSPPRRIDLHDPKLHELVASSNHRQKVLKHFENRFGSASMVFHETRSKVVHVDVHVFAASEERPFLTLATCGMSAAEMTIEGGNNETTFEDPSSSRKRELSRETETRPPDHLSRAELILYLPEDWDFYGSDGMLPVQYLIQTAKYPHIYKTYLGEGHSVANDPESLPYFDGSLLTTTYLMYPFLEEAEVGGDNFFHFDIDENCHLHVYWVQPVTLAENYIKRTEGLRALNIALIDNDVFTLDIDRACTVTVEGRKERRAREKAQKRRRSRDRRLPWPDLPCGSCQMTLGEMADRGTDASG